MPRFEIIRRGDEFILVRRHPILNLVGWLLVMGLAVSAIDEDWWAAIALAAATVMALGLWAAKAATHH